MSRESIAFVLKSRRKMCGLTAEQVVSTLDAQYHITISIKTLYSYESGHRQPDADTLMALCDIYQIEDILLEFGYKEKEPGTDTDAQLTPDEKLFMGLPENLRKDALRYMRYLVEQEGRQE